MRLGGWRRNWRRAKGLCLLTFFLVLLWPSGYLCAQVSASGQAQAAAPRYGGWPGAAQVAGQLNYRDLTGHWAAAMILRVAGLGIFQGQGSYFRPQAGLTRREALAGLLRAVGTATRGGAASGPPATQAAPGDLLLNQAEQAGLILRDERDRIAAGLDQAVARQEMAAWLARALGLTPQSAPGPRFLAAFADASQVREEYVGLLEGLLQQGLLAGRGRYLAPAAPVTRAEAAALIGRALPALLTSQGWRVAEGLILTKDEIRVAQGQQLNFRFRAGNGEEWLLQSGPGLGSAWAQDWLVIKGDKAGTSSLLAAGDLGRVWLRGDQVVLVEVLPAARQQLTGLIETVSPQQGVLVVNVGGRREEFSLHPAARVTVGGQSATLADLLPGQGVSLVVRGGLAEEVAAELAAADLPAYRQPATRTLTGILLSREGASVRVRLADGREETWDLAATTVITAGGRALAPAELRPGDVLRLTVEEGFPGRLVKVEVTKDYPPETLWYGRLVRVQPLDRVVVLAAARRLNYGRWLGPEDYRSFALAPEAEIYLGSRRVDLTELAGAASGGQVFLAARSGLGGEEVSWVLVQEGEAWIYQDRLEASSPSRRQLTLAQGTVLEVASGARLIRAGRTVSLADLSLAAPAQVVAAGGVAVFVEQPEYYPPSWRFYSGTLKEVRERSLVLDDWCQYTGEVWSDADSDEREFAMAGTATVIDGTAEGARVLDAFTFLESRFTQAFAGRTAHLVADEDGRVLALALRREAPGQEVTSLGTVAAIGSDGRVVLQDVLDWSVGYRGWRAVDVSLRLDMSRALVFQGEQWIGPAGLAPGDLIYLLHDYNQGLIAFRLPH